MKPVEVVGDGVAMRVEAFRDKSGLRSLVAHANDKKLRLGPFRVRRIVDGFGEILDFWAVRWISIIA